MADEADAVGALVRVARPIILEEFYPDSCLASTFVACEALTYFGVRAEPMVCKAMAWNKRYAERFAKKQRPLDDPEAHAVGIGYYDPGWKLRGRRSQKPYWGHLVAQTTNYIVDLSIDQVSRPEKGIVLGPRAWPRDENWPHGSAVYVGEDGVVIYEPEPDRRDFAAHWKAGPTAQVAGRVIRAMRSELEVAS